jgi:hypothetical protein
VTLSRAPRSSVSASRASQAACALSASTAARHLRVGDMLGQPVRAEDEDVAAFDLAVFEVEFGRVVDADRAGDDVPARRALRLLGGEQAAIDHVLDLGMVARNLRDHTARTR